MSGLNVEFDVPATMRDGAVLRANIFRPAGDEKHPVVLLRTPYGKNFVTTSPWLDAVRLARSGYMVIIQDVRGRFASEGEFGFMDSSGEARDGYDTVEWASQLPQASGAVGMAGSSYVGDVQWAAASLQPPHLKAIMPMVITDDPCNGRIWRGGAMELGSRAHWLVNTIALNQAQRRNASSSAAEQSAAEQKEAVEQIAAEVDALIAQGYWSLPLADFAPLARLGLPLDAIRRGYDQAHYHPLAVSHFYPQVTVPAFNVGGWYDLFGQGTINNYRLLRRQGRTPQARQNKLLIGPWAHVNQSNVVGDLDFGFRSTAGFMDLKTDMTSLAQRWFDYWLKGIDNGITGEPPIKLFIMGANRWRDEHEWPLERTRYTPYFLHSAGKANTLQGDGALATAQPGSELADRFTYDPEHPVPTLGGAILMNATYGPGVKDQRARSSNGPMSWSTRPRRLSAIPRSPGQSP